MVESLNKISLAMKRQYLSVFSSDFCSSTLKKFKDSISSKLKQILTGLFSLGEKISIMSPLTANSPLFLTNSTFSYILVFKNSKIFS